MAYPAKTREKAFSLYRRLQSTYAVGKQLGIHPTTIDNWRVKYDWDEKIEKIREKVMELEAKKSLTEKEKSIEEHKRIIAKYAKDDEDNLKILKAFKAICIDEINRHKSRPEGSALEIKSLKDATDVMNNVIKLERLIKGDPTEYMHHTISPIAMHNQERSRREEILRSLREEIDEIKKGRFIEHVDSKT